MNALEKLGFKIYDVSEITVTYHRYNEVYDDDTFEYDGSRVEIDFKDNSIRFFQVIDGKWDIWQTPLDVIEASIDVLKSRKIEVTF